jgi:hypothetical protein
MQRRLSACSGPVSVAQAFSPVTGRQSFHIHGTFWSTQRASCHAVGYHAVLPSRQCRGASYSGVLSAARHLLHDVGCTMSVACCSFKAAAPQQRLRKSGNLAQHESRAHPSTSITRMRAVPYRAVPTVTCPKRERARACGAHEHSLVCVDVRDHAIKVRVLRGQALVRPVTVAQTARSGVDVRLVDALAVADHALASRVGACPRQTPGASAPKQDGRTHPRCRCGAVVPPLRQWPIPIRSNAHHAAAGSTREGRHGCNGVRMS